MKSILGLAAFTVALVLVSFIPGSTRPYPEYAANGFDDIATAFRTGNAGQLSRYLDNRVDIALPEKSDSYSKSQAEMIIRDFFNTNGVRNFMIRRQSDNGATEYCVGVLQTRNGDYFTSLFLKVKGDRQLLQELRFQPTSR